MVIVRNRYQKWKGHDEISKVFNFEVTDVLSATFYDYFNVQKITKTYRKKKLLVGKLCHPAYKSFIIFKLSNCPKILHLNVGGLKIGNPTNFMTPFPFQPSISSHDHLLRLTRSRDTVMQRAHLIDLTTFQFQQGDGLSTLLLGFKTLTLEAPIVTSIYFLLTTSPLDQTYRS